jgi:hypothetical protein
MFGNLDLQKSIFWVPSIPLESALLFETHRQYLSSNNRPRSHLVLLAVITHRPHGTGRKPNKTKSLASSSRIVVSFYTIPYHARYKTKPSRSNNDQRRDHAKRYALNHFVHRHHVNANPRGKLGFCTLAVVAAGRHHAGRGGGGGPVVVAVPTTRVQWLPL